MAQFVPFRCSMVLEQLKLRGEIMPLDFHFWDHFVDLHPLREQMNKPKTNIDKVILDDYFFYQCYA